MPEVLDSISGWFQSLP